MVDLEFDSIFAFRFQKLRIPSSFPFPFGRRVRSRAGVRVDELACWLEKSGIRFDAF